MTGDQMLRTSVPSRQMHNHGLRFGAGRKSWVPAIVAATLACVPATWPQMTAESAPGLPSRVADPGAERLMEKNKERAAGVQNYSATRNYRLECRGFPASTDATMEVEVNYDAPGAKRFTVLSSTGSKMIQNRVFQRLLESEQQASDSGNRAHSELGPGNYNFSMAGTDGTNYVLNVEPKVESKFLYRGKIWVDAHDFAVTRIEAQPARNPSFWTTKSMIHHTYQRVDSEFYLPKENKTITSVRLGGTATLTIEYQSYQVTAAQPLSSGRKAASSSGAQVMADSAITEQAA